MNGFKVRMLLAVLLIGLTCLIPATPVAAAQSMGTIANSGGTITTSPTNLYYGANTITVTGLVTLTVTLYWFAIRL